MSFSLLFIWLPVANHFIKGALSTEDQKRQIFGSLNHDIPSFVSDSLQHIEEQKHM